jgi:small GTP-binding protein
MEGNASIHDPCKSMEGRFHFCQYSMAAQLYMFYNAMFEFRDPIHFRISGEDVRLMLWDTAGQEEFDAITKAYYRGAQACVIAFSTIDRKSFEAVKKWKKKVEDECGGPNVIPMVLVQNKIDLMHQSQVTP